MDRDRDVVYAFPAEQCRSRGPRGPSSVAVASDTVFRFAADASYTEQLMFAGVADGDSPDPAAARATLARIQRLVADRPPSTSQATTRPPQRDSPSASTSAHRRCR